MTKTKIFTGNKNKSNVIFQHLSKNIVTFDCTSILCPLWKDYRQNIEKMLNNPADPEFSTFQEDWTGTVRRSPAGAQRMRPEPLKRSFPASLIRRDSLPQGISFSLKLWGKGGLEHGCQVTVLISKEVPHR